MSVPLFVRIGNKLISRQKIDREIERILASRARGMSQQQVAKELGTDRTFISRLESLGEVHKGKRIALVGFPLANKSELEQVAAEEGLDFVLLMSNQERWEYVAGKNGSVLIQEIVQLISKARDHDVVVFIGSDERVKMAEALMNGEFAAIEIGKSPIVEDKYVDPQRLRELIRALRQKPSPSLR